MKFRLSMLWLLIGWAASAQPEFTLKSGEELSHLNQYGRSTEELEAFIEANPARLYDQSQALLLISYNHMQLGDFANALSTNETSLDIKAQLHADDLVNNYVRFGAIHLLRGNHHAALSYLLKAKDFPIEAIQLYAVIDGYLAAAYRGLGQYELAETYYRQSIETLLIEYPEDHPNIITSYYNLGELYLEWDRPEMAQRYFQIGLDRNTPVAGQAFLQALLNNGLGAAFPEDPQRAEVYHRRALNNATEYFGGYHRETALSSLLLAKVLYQQQRRDAARDALQLAIRSLNPEQPNLSWMQMPDTTRLIIDGPLLAEALGLRARWLMDSALPKEEKLVPALVNSELAAQLLEIAINDRIDQADRMKLLPIARKALEGGIAAAVQLWQQNGDDNAQRRAFQLVETLKALQFRAYTSHILQLSGTYAERERDLHRSIRLAEMEFRLQPLDLTVSREVQRLQEKYRLLREDWRRADPLTYQQRFGSPRPSVRTLQQGLSEEEGLLSYFVGTKQSFVFALDRNGLQTFILGFGEATEIRALNSQIHTFNEAIDSSNAEVFTTLGYQLYEQLLGPAANWLRRKSNISIVPDASLYDLPFEALLTDEYRKSRIKWHKLPYLIKDLAIGYRHTAYTLLETDRVAPHQYEFLFLSPIFDEDRLRGIVPNLRVLLDPNIHQGISISDGKRFYELPLAAEVSEQLQLLWAQNEQEGRFKLREAATELLLKSELGKAHYVHLSTYTFVEGTSPEEAGLILAAPSGGENTGDDGFYLASELPVRSSLGTELLSIDFIEKGIIDNGRPIPILPLSGSLMLTGISNILYTTRQNSASGFYPLFYEYLLAENGITESLRKTKIAMLKQTKTADPKWWTGFTLLSR